LPGRLSLAILSVCPLFVWVFLRGACVSDLFPPLSPPTLYLAPLPVPRVGVVCSGDSGPTDFALRVVHCPPFLAGEAYPSVRSGFPGDSRSPDPLSLVTLSPRQAVPGTTLRAVAWTVGDARSADSALRVVRRPPFVAGETRPTPPLPSPLFRAFRFALSPASLHTLRSLPRCDSPSGDLALRVRGPRAPRPASFLGGSAVSPPPPYALPGPSLRPRPAVSTLPP
jgi:hypothetical protein